jgi:hypothetical protein
MRKILAKAQDIDVSRNSPLLWSCNCAEWFKAAQETKRDLVVQTKQGKRSFAVSRAPNPALVFSAR